MKVEDARELYVPGRGRDALLPRDLPPRAWADILKRFGAGFLDDHLMLVAAGVAYYSLLAFFPAIALFVSVYGLIADASQAADQARSLAGILPADAAEFLYAEMTRVASAPPVSLGFAGLVSLGITIWGAGRTMRSLFEAMNIAYHEKERRNILVVNALGAAFTIGLIVFVAVTVLLVVAVPPLLEALRLPGPLEALVSLIRWPILFGGMFLGTSLLYRLGPDREAPRMSWVRPGSLLAAALWLAASGLISWYASSFADFNKTYGSLGAVVLLQFWVWVTVLIVLVGAKLNAEAEHQTAVDTTTGRPMPLGERGAVVADSLGTIKTREKPEASDTPL